MSSRAGGCVVRLALLSGLLQLGIAQGAEHSHGASSDDPTLPEAPERDDVTRFCTACHGIERVRHSGSTDAGWQDRIQRMVRWGAQIPQSRIAPVASYLAKVLPLRPRPAASLAYFANTAVRTVSVEDIQLTMRLAAVPTSDGQLRAAVGEEAAAKLSAGQRARVFSVGARSDMIPATVTLLNRRRDEYEALLRTVRPLSASDGARSAYLAEVVISGGRHLAVPIAGGSGIRPLLSVAVSTPSAQKF